MSYHYKCAAMHITTCLLHMYVTVWFCIASYVCHSMATVYTCTAGYAHTHVRGGTDTDVCDMCRTYLVSDMVSLSAPRPPALVIDPMSRILQQTPVWHSNASHLFRTSGQTDPFRHSDLRVYPLSRSAPVLIAIMNSYY